MRGKSNVIGEPVDRCQLRKGLVYQMLILITHDYDILADVGGHDGVTVLIKECYWGAALPLLAVGSAE